MAFVREKKDIDLNDPEVQKAATKIQAGFRGHKARKEVKETAHPSEPNAEDEEIAAIDLTDPELADAALKIQAGFRGAKARKEIMKKEEADLNQKLGNLNTEAEEELDIDLTDPDLNKAATKIQATFRGHKQRANP
ncbi:obscurin-like [Eriocheir sinensis]|uniref:obscurin-like n=1 Tax=Eriocheir sinensis TaxID=95602 RepID=UPI0021C88EE8|nr:obscurin-like [Eriocheir sinensis]